MSHRLQVADGSVAYEIVGEGGLAVVAVPAIGDTRASYRALVPLLVAAGHTVYVMDLRGHGESDATFQTYTSEDIGDDVVALLDALDLHDVTLLGNSVGGAAIAHAALRSERVGRLVMLSAFLADPPNFGLMRVMLGVMFAGFWGVPVWGSYRKTLFASPPADMDDNQAALVANLREPGRLRAVRAMMRASKADIAARVGEVRAPVLIAMGAQDPDFKDPAAEARRQADALGGDNRVVLIDGAGHYPQIERPEQTAEAILAFVGQGVAVGA